MLTSAVGTLQWQGSSSTIVEIVWTFSAIVRRELFYVSATQSVESYFCNLPCYHIDVQAWLQMSTLNDWAQCIFFPLGWQLCLSMPPHVFSKTCFCLDQLFIIGLVFNVEYSKVVQTLGYPMQVKYSFTCWGWMIERNASFPPLGWQIILWMPPYVCFKHYFFPRLFIYY